MIPLPRFLQEIGVKQRIMELMSHPDQEVRYNSVNASWSLIGGGGGRVWKKDNTRRHSQKETEHDEIWYWSTERKEKKVDMANHTGS